MEKLRKDSLQEEIRDNVRGFLHTFQDEIRKLHRDRTHSGTSLAEMRSTATDAMLTMALRGLGYKALQGVSLIALGGYGREELCPHSDIDLLFLYDPKRKGLTKDICANILYLLWDLNLKIGHSVRTIDDCMELGRGDDITVLTSMLDGRLIFGDEPLWKKLERKLYRELLPAISREFIEKKLDEYETRISKYGRSVYLQEPHIKEGEGGLRDIHTALWIAKAKYKVKSLAELLQKTIILERDLKVFEKGLDFLLTIRSELHYLAGRDDDRLGFQWQEEVAKFMGYKPLGGLPAVERFMRVYYLHANTITEHTRKLIDRCIYKPEVRFKAYKTSRLDHGFIVRGGKLSVTNRNIFNEHPEYMMTAFEYADKHGVKIGSFLETLIRDSVRLIDDNVRRNPVMNASFIRLLRYGEHVYETLQEMNRLRLLGHYIPEFGKIVCLSQHDAYHVYTVDIHSIFMAREIEDRIKAAEADGFPLVTELAKKIRKRHILYLACLFHDMGKGSGKGHSKRGATMVPKIAKRMGLSTAETNQLQYLVRRHLIMTHISQRRDMHDENLIYRFSKSVRTLDTLRLLYLLTFADIRSVGPDVWTNWKGMLLEELYLRTAPVLEQGKIARKTPQKRAKLLTLEVIEKLAGRVNEKSIKRFLKPMPLSYYMSFSAKTIAYHVETFGDIKEDVYTDVLPNEEVGFDEFTFWGQDEVGIFSKLSGVLSAHGLNILGARLATRTDGRILDVFYVNKNGRSTSGDKTLWRRVRRDLSNFLAGKTDIEQKVLRKKRHKSPYRKAIPTLPTKIEFDNTSSTESTVIDIYTHDRAGLLFDISKTLSSLGLSIEYAKISTKVDQVADVFYVREREGGKIMDPARLETIKTTLLRAIEEEPDGKER